MTCSSKAVAVRATPSGRSSGLASGLASGRDFGRDFERAAALVSALASVLVALMVFLAAPASALAGPLEDARQQGLVGERADGLLGAVSPASLPAEVARLMAEVNTRRLARYQEIANGNGTSVQAVQVVAGQKLIERATAGQWVNRGSGWERK